MNGKKILMLTPDDKMLMMKESAKTCSELYDFLLYVDNDTLVVNPTVKDLILSLASTSPVCSYVHFNETVKTLLKAATSEGVNVKESPVNLKLLRTSFLMIQSPACHNHW